MSLVDAVEVANAALAEVGLPQTARRHEDTILFDPSPLAYRAVALGALAQYGPSRRCYCLVHAPQWETVERCTTVADALMGRPCELSS